MGLTHRVFTIDGGNARRGRVVSQVASDRDRQGEQVVLVDDVLTLGGHLRACAAKLREEGADVLLGLCAARADQIPAKDPFAVRCEILSDLSRERSLS